jgi:hypothetical protein
MASTTPPRRPTWLSYYHALATGKDPERKVLDSVLSAYNEKCDQYLNDEAKFLSTILGREKLGIIILPATTSVKVNILHNCMHDEEGKDNAKIIGILGNKFTSPWYGFAPKDAIRPLKPPSPTRTKSSVSSLKQFSEVKSAEDFRSLGQPQGRHRQHPPPPKWPAPPPKTLPDLRELRDRQTRRPRIQDHCRGKLRVWR